ncbi:MAG: hypothetical protein ACJ79A_11525 [Gemmatimonadaceae bacterium]
MSIVYWIDPVRPLVHVRAWGALTPTQLREHQARLAADPQFDPAFWQLTDLRELVHVDGSTEELEANSVHPLFCPGVRRAVLVANEYQIAFTRLFAKLATAVGQQVKIFHDPEAAERWLSA